MVLANLSIKKNNYIISFLLFISFITKSFSQNAAFVRQGYIEFEKKVNTYALLTEQYKNSGNWGEKFIETYKKNNAEFKIKNFNLYFGNKNALYQPQNINKNANDNNIFDYFGQVAFDNIIFSQLQFDSSITQKKIFEDIFLIKDRIRKVKWKITSETREIAGFHCHRANAIIMDSVYVVAFYTDQIITESGPESFTGLPGMILGVALPNEHTTWFATEVVSQDVSNLLAAPKEGKVVNHNQFNSILVTNASTKEFLIEALL